MERVFGSYYNNQSAHDSLNLPDNVAALAAGHVYSYDSEEGRHWSRKLREKVDAGETAYLLGFQSVYHNSGAALIEVSAARGVRLLVNFEEERFAGEKHFAGYPEHSISEIKRLLSSLGRSPEDIFCVLYGWDVGAHERHTQKTLILDKKITANERYLHLSHSVLSADAKARLNAPKKGEYYIFSPLVVETVARLMADLGKDAADCPCIQMLHHENHAYYAFGSSPFYTERHSETVMVSCVDGGGDLSSSSLFRSNGDALELVKRLPSTSSLGVFYMLCASFLGGWSALSSEGRYMGAAAWGRYDRLTNPYYKQLRQYFYFDQNGEVRVNSALTENEHARLQDFLGPLLKPEDLWNPDAVLKVDDVAHSPITRERVDKAAAVQMVFEDALFHIVSDLIHASDGADKLVLCGGTALNCVANMRLLEHFDEAYYRRYFNKSTRLNLWVPPIPSDQGVIPGAAFQFAMRAGVPAEGRLPTPFLCGQPPQADAVETALAEAEFAEYEPAGDLNDPEQMNDLADFMAFMVSQGGVVGIYQGAAETGPRALGHRSFLADPRNPETLETLNSRVKLRERIRPLAPMVTREDAERLFHLSPGAKAGDYDAYDYMVLNARARAEAHAKVPAVIHHDGTSRIQIVRERNNPLIHAYLKAMGRRAGVEVSVNTSLNVGGPIVQHPAQALDIFNRAKGLDCLVMVAADGRATYVWAKPGVQAFETRYHAFKAAYAADKAVPKPAPIEPAMAEQKVILAALKAGEIDREEAKAKLTALRGEKASTAPAPIAPASPVKRDTDIAIIGLSGKFPGADNVHAFWRMIANGERAVTSGPQGRGWDVASYYDPSPQTPGKTYSRHGGYLDKVDQFDPLFFGVAPREAERMDPSERLFLQEAWRAIEDAGYAASSLAGKAWGVFACAKGDYASYVQNHDPLHHAPTDSYAPARLAYLLDLTGPCVSVDTACSSTLAAIAQACDALNRGDAEVAVAGGGGVYTTPNMLIYSSQAGLFSQTGQCRAFDASADGTVLGEAIGAVILKPLSAAKRDGDQVYGVIKGWGVNQDGRTNGITAPSARAQSRLQQAVYKRFDIDPSTISLVEAHGTGTILGDPIEVQALTESFRAHTDKRGWCALTSLKSNIGHAFFGAGVAAVSKVLLAMQHRQIPPAVNFETPNPRLGLADSPFHIPTELHDWESDGPRRAAINAFGATGVNVHLVIEEAPPRAAAPTAVSSHPAPIALSAKTPERLRAAAEALRAFLVEKPTQGMALPQPVLESLAYTLLTGREAMPARLAFTARSLKEVGDKLSAFLANDLGGVHVGDAKADAATLTLFEDEDLHAAVSGWMAKGKFDKLLSLWVKGLALDWSALYKEAPPPAKISLPTYRFAEERHWIGAGLWPNQPAVGRQPHFLHKSWDATPLPNTVCALQGPIAVLASPQTASLAQAVVERLPDARVVDDLDALPTAVGAIDLTGVIQGSATHDWSWIAPLQRLVERRRSQGLRLLAVTRGLEGAGNLKGATRAALHRLIQGEYAEVRGTWLDLDDKANAAEAIAAEYLYGDSPQARRRGDERLTARLAKTPAPAAAPLAFPKDYTLLITGGTRGLGLLCAHHFVKTHGVRRLLLLGREALPQRTKWSSAQGPALEKIKAIQAFERQGVLVETAAVDLTDSAALRGSIAQSTSRLGLIGGMLHCAGLADYDDPAFIHKPLTTFEKITAPKTQGLDTLLNALAEQPLAFGVLFSSVAGVIPMLASGRLDYAMANAYMDDAARACAGELSYPLVSLQWPSWRDAGMGAVDNPVYNATGLHSHSNAEGLALLDQALMGGLGPVATPAMVDPSRMNPEQLLTAQTAPTVKPKSRPALAETLQFSTITDQSTDVAGRARDWLTGLFADALKIDIARLDPAAPLQDYGADSILLSQARAKIDRTLGIKMDPSALLAAPSLAEFSDWLIQAHGPALLEITPPTPPLVAAPKSEKPKTIIIEHVLDLIDPTAPPKSAAAAKPAETPPAQSGDLAIVGMACRFPDAPDLEAYWRLLSEGRRAIRRSEREGWDAAYSAALLDDIRRFDPAYFLIPEADAAAMDPQAHVALEECLKAIHHAGYRPKDIKGARIGVYLGARSWHIPDEAALAEARDPIVATGQNYLAANISHFFDLRGPSLVVDTACSSTLTALAMAEAALARGEIESALVGGVSLLADDRALKVMARRGLLAPSGAFHLFDSRAEGLILGEGAGALMVKTLTQALADGDQIHAVIKGLSVNNDGRTAGPATPNPVAQRAVMREALAKSGVSPQDVTYLEVNGSGSEVTDLLELKAIEAVYRPEGGGPLSLGSMKPNIGHPLCAEGAAALIKAALSVSHGRVVPFLSAEAPMAHYDLAASPFVFDRAAGAGPQVAALNCFADGGANAHVVLTAPPEHTPVRAPLDPPQLNKVDVYARVRQAAPVKRAESFSKRLILDADHPVLKNHKAYGQALLPGMAYIDLLLRVFTEKGHAWRGLSIRDLALFAPLSVSEAFDVVLTLRCEAENNGWRVEAIGREEPHDGGPATEKRYMTARIAQESAQFSERLDLGSLQSEATQTLATFYARCRDQDLIHTGVMQAEGTVYARPDASIVQISVASDPILGDVLFHPALLDGSGVAFAGMFDTVQSERRLYLPLHFKSFQAAAPLTERCVTRIPRDSIQEKNELLTFSMQFFDETGRQVAELRDISNKLVRREGLINPDRALQTTLSAPPPKPQRAPVSGAAQPAAVQSPPSNGGSEGAAAYLCDLLAKQLGLAAEDVELDVGYYEMGLDSAGLLTLVTQIEAHLGAPLAPTLFFEYVTVGDLAEYLTQEYPNKWGGAPVRTAQTAAPLVVDLQPEPQISAAPAAPLNAGSKDIAIIGLSGRYPQSPDIRAFWDNLLGGVDCIIETPPERWDYEEAFGDVTSPSGKPMSRFGGFLEDVDCFDARFFRTAGREAEVMDPQDRLFLETCWSAMEDSGYTPGTIVPPRGPDKRRDVGVFCGIMHKDYTIVGAEALSKDNPFGLTINYAPIPNRVSYFCDFHGPSMAVDTVCSSSLTTIHLAAQSILSGECKVAIAGGVNLSLHPAKYLIYGVGELHALDGRCRAFGEGGTGYVSAEGVGAAILKPLADAQRDGDHIYAVIKGSSINHVGKVSGITVPGPIAQAEMIRDVHVKTGIDPRTMGYIEAHGTGTVLGDPIEVQGLARAYRQFTDNRQFCAIGSVKSNMGHGESAAGIMGLTKAALQLRWRTLTPSLHSETLNPHIDFSATPFYVQRELAKWPDPVDHPRRSAVSSFGATGSNAHILLEEPPAESPRAVGQEPVLLPLSAKDKTRLVDYVERLRWFLTTPGDMGGMDVAITDLAYTFQVGREAMPERAAFVASDRLGLVAQLQAFIANHGAPAPAYQRGKAARKPEAGAKQAAAEAAGRADLEALAQLWVSGAPVDWAMLSRTGQPRRVSAPTYPFARDRFWVPQPPEGARKVPLAALSAAPAAKPAKSPYRLELAPVANGEDGAARVTLTGDEFFLTDHVVGGEKILPGVVSLDIVLEAVRRSWPDVVANKAPIFRNVAWFQRVVVENGPTTLRVGLKRQGDGAAYTVTIEREGEPDQTQGAGVLAPHTIETETVDVADRLRACSERVIEGVAIYQDYYRPIGFEYGPAHQSIARMNIGGGEVMIEVVTPPSIAGSEGDFALHPSLLDAALQGTIGTDFRDTGGEIKPRLPFAFDSVEVYAGMRRKMWAWIRESARPGRLHKLDIDMLGEDGVVLLRMCGFASRVVEPASPEEAAPPALIYTPEWVNAPARPSAAPEERLVFSCALHHPPMGTVELARTGQTDAAAYAGAARDLFTRIKTILLGKPKRPVLIQVAVPADGPGLVFQSLSGLLRSAQAENPRIIGQIIAVSPAASAESLGAILQEESATADRFVRRAANSLRQVRRLSEIAAEARSPWREGGVYLITGGAGGLGRLFAERIAQTIRSGAVILTGRSALNAERKADLDRLSRGGVTVEYAAVDAANAAALTPLISDVQSRHGPLAGVIHSAGIIRDNFIIRKELSDFDAVLAPKVAGAEALDAATQDLRLDFFALFSSGAGVTGNLGQTDYAAANAYLDAFAARRAELAADGRRFGRSISIDWPLWRSGGMTIDAAFEKRMTDATGMVALETNPGLDAFAAALASGAAQTVVMAGERTALDAFLEREGLGGSAALAQLTAVPDSKPDSKPVAAPGVGLEAAACAYLTDRLAAVVKLPATDIDPDAPLEDYGVDSIMVIQLTNDLEADFGSLPKTLFFDYQTLSELTDYLTQEHAETLRALFGDALETAPSPQAVDVRAAALALLTDRLAAVVKLPATDIDPDAPLEDYGVDSIMVIQLTNDLEADFGSLPKTLFFDYQTLSELADYFCAEHAGSFADAAPTPAPVNESSHPPLPGPESEHDCGLSYGQQAFCFLYESDPDSAAYNVPFVIRVNADVEEATLRRALHRLIARHASLRATFPIEGDARVQRFKGDAAPALEIVDAFGLEGDALTRRIDACYRRPFDLADGPLFRAHVLRTGPSDCVLLLVAHHIVCDGWSLGALVHDFGEIWGAEQEGRLAELPDLPADYVDFVDRQQQLLAGPEGEALWDHWREKLSGELAPLALPLSYPRPREVTYNGATHWLDFDDAFVADLRAFARREGVSFFTALLTGYTAVLHRYTGQNDIILGAPFSGRTETRFNGVVGDLINPVVLRADLSGDPSIRELFARTRTLMRDALAHQEYPFPLLVEKLRVPRDPSRSPIFEAMFNFIQMPEAMGRMMLPMEGSGDLTWAGAPVTPVFFPNQEGQLSLTFETLEVGRSLYSVLKYNTDLFDPSLIKALGGHLKTALRAMIDAPETTVSRLPLMSEEEQAIIAAANQTAAEHPHAAIHALFETQVAARPDAAAVIAGEQAVSYGDLDRQANRIANGLIAAGVQTGDRCALYFKPGAAMIAAILGTLKAGAAYVPIDPDYPEDRVRYILEDSNPAVMLAADDLAQEAAAHGAKTVLTVADCANAPDTAPDRVISPETTAYIIYTSGSTGRPKGCLVSHDNVVRLMINDKHPFAFAPEDVWVMAHSYCFDFSVWEMYGALLYGGTLLAPAREDVRDVDRFLDLIETHRVSVLNQTPGAFYGLIDEALARGSSLNTHLRYVVFGGDKLSPARLGAWAEAYGLDQPALINMYGITETTVHVTHHQITSDDLTDSRPGSPIGVPIPETTVHILDRYGAPVPPGVIGEMYVGGGRVCQGYFGRPELTADRFAPNPFGEGRLYRSGDLAKRDFDGLLWYFGRNDHQVKIRGHRIEVKEIEHRLLTHTAVREAVVLPHGEPAELLAFTVGEATSAELKAWVGAALPEFMTPARFYTLDALPLTANGKIDRAALLLHAQETAVVQTPVMPAEPRDDLEAQVMDAWRAVLMPERPFGVHENYFDLGGDSLNAGQLAARLRRGLQIKFSLQEVFQNSTVAEMAAALRDRLGLPALALAAQASEPKVEAEKTAEPAPDLAPVAEFEAAHDAAIPAAPEQDVYPLTHAQRRMWVLEQMEPGGTAYIISLPIELSGPVDEDALELAFQALIDRHEALRATFETINGAPVQRFARQTTADWTLTDLTCAEDPEAEAHALAVVEGRRGFDLGRGPLLRGRLLRLSDQRRVLLLAAHHIVVDGLSLGVLFKEMAKLYAAARDGSADPLPAPPLRYRDYVMWSESQSDADSRAYWLDALGGDHGRLTLPPDHPRPPMQTYRGRLLSFDLGSELTNALQSFRRERRVTLYMALLAVTKAVLYKYSGERDAIVGTPVGGRTRQDLQGLVGLLTNTVALRSNLSPTESFAANLKRVAAAAAEGFAHQTYPFDRLVDELGAPRDLSRSPLFDVMVALLPRNTLLPNVPGAEVDFFVAPREVSMFDLTMEFLHDDDAPITLLIEHNADLYDEATIHRLYRSWRTLCEAAIADPNQLLAQLPFLAQEDAGPVLKGPSVDVEDATLVDLIEAQAARTPESPAIFDQEEILTYADLNRRANRLAHALATAESLQPDDVVALAVGRSWRVMAGALGILKTGAAYLPLDPYGPSERLKTILADSDCRALVADTAAAERLEPVLAELGIEIIDIDAATVEIEIKTGVVVDLAAQGRDENPDVQAHPSDLAYVIYTSGTTGKPKGVMVEHRAAVNLTQAMRTQVYAAHDGPLEEGFTANTAFDVSVQQIFCPLVGGDTLRILDQEALEDPRRMLAKLRAHPIAIIDVTPGQFAALLEAGLGEAETSLRQINLGGEALPVDLPRRFYSNGRNRHVRLLNFYGPTESCVNATLYSLDPEALPQNGFAPIGAPMANMEALIGNADGQPLPIGVEGEVFIGGAGLARGYMNQASLTSERFITAAAGRLYRTGDLGQLSKAGLVFHGRRDEQIKLRGFRIELTEVEAAMRNWPGVAVATATVQNGALFGYIAAPDSVDASALKAALADRLPTHMIPAQIIRLDALPLTAVGKIDKAALPAPEIKTASAEPQTETEQRLAAIIAEVLGRDAIDVDANFFDLGGDSLRAVQTLLRVQVIFGVETSLGVFFQEPSVRALAAVIDAAAAATPAMLLNAPADQAIFCLPPVFGYGAAYSALAQDIPDCAVYALDSPPGDFVDGCVAAIRAAQTEGPYRLLGYSAGGNLAFEVAKALEAAGDAATSVILLDSMRLSGKNTGLATTIDEEAEGIYAQYAAVMAEDAAMKPLLADPAFRDGVLARARRYLAFLSETVNDGQIRGDLTLISSETDFGPLGWGQATSGAFKQLQGTGAHEAMLFGSAAKANAALVAPLLQRPSGGRAQKSEAS